MTKGALGMISAELRDMAKKKEWQKACKMVIAEKRRFFPEEGKRPLPDGESSQTILLTGGAGFIGSHLTERLLGEGHRVVAIDNFNEVYAPYKKWQNVERFTGLPQYKLVVGDIRDRAALNKAFRAAASLSSGDFQIIHLAALAGVTQSVPEGVPPSVLSDKRAAKYRPADIEYYEVNVMGTANILAFARHYGAKNIVAASSSSVYGGNEFPPFKETDDTSRPLGPYAASKRMNEYQASAFYFNHRIPITMLRYFTVYGIRGRPEMIFWFFFDSMKKGVPVRQRSSDSSTRSYTHISDIVGGVAACTRQKYINDNFRKKKGAASEVLNMGGSQTVKLGYLRRLVAGELGLKPRMDRQKADPADVPASSAITSRAQKLVGYWARMTIERGVKEYGKWYRQQEKYQPIYDEYRKLMDRVAKKGSLSPGEARRAAAVTDKLSWLVEELDPAGHAQRAGLSSGVNRSEYLTALQFLSNSLAQVS